jgi:hypothetical protein
MKSMLNFLLILVLATSVFSGILMMAMPDGSALRLPINILQRTPFSDFSIPGFLLMTIVGGSAMVALFYSMTSSKRQYNWSVTAGTIVILWIMLQYFMIGMHVWFNLFFIAVAILIILLGLYHKGKMLI